MKSVTCPYCQTELVGDFRPGDVIECNSCKGHFQPPPDFLKDYAGSRIVCPYCKSSLVDDVWSGKFVQCPVCKGRFEKEEKRVIEIPRPSGIKTGVGLFTALTLFGAVFFVGMFAGGRANEHSVLMETAIRSCVGSLPAFVLSVLVAWKAFKGRNWARWVLNIGLPATIVLAFLRAVSQSAVVRYSFNVQASELETLFWIDFGVKTLLGIGALCCLNSRKSRTWLHLSQNNKHSRDFPWWPFVLFIVVLCPALLLLATGASRKTTLSQVWKHKSQSSVSLMIGGGGWSGKGHSDDYSSRARYLVETLAKIKASDGDTNEALYSTSKDFGIEGKSLSSWLDIVQSERFVTDAIQSDEGRLTFDAVEQSILIAAGQRGLLSSNLDDIDKGPVWLPDFGLVKDRKDLEEGRAWNAARREEQIDIVRKIDFLKRFSKGDDPNAGFYGATLDQLRAFVLGNAVRNRGDRKMQEGWDDFVKQVNDRFEREREVWGLGVDSKGKQNPVANIVSSFLDNPEAAKGLIMVQIPDKPYIIGRYEVTQALWKEIMGGDDPSTSKGANLPVENVSWEDCQIFLKKLNAFPEVKQSGLVFRLPTKQEWNYACQAGSSGDFCKLLDGTDVAETMLARVAWFDDNSLGLPHPVGMKEPNAFGLYDMIGNVEEWTQTPVAGSMEGTTKKPIYEGYSIRGGGYFSVLDWCKISHEVYLSANDRDEGLGFRLCADHKDSN